MKFKLICVLLISFGNINAQDSFILNYEDVDIKKVTQDIAQFSKKTIILDPRVKGKITIYSNANLNRDQVWDVYLRTIQVNGFGAISEDGFLRVVPENEATRDMTSDSSLGGFETAVSKPPKEESLVISRVASFSGTTLRNPSSEIAPKPLTWIVLKYTSQT